jgi:molecular chaperone GrpE
MSDTRYSDEPDAENFGDDTDQEPQFGLVDVIEAFTAMRQEWRTQSRETRELSQSLAGVADGIAGLEQRLLGAAAKIQEVAAQASSDDESRRLADTIAEMDQHVLRAVQAVSRTSVAASKIDANALQALLMSDVQSLGAVRRWFARPLIHKIESSFKRWAEREAENRTEDTIAQGLQMLIDRVQRLMADQHIERIETFGQAFDGQTMNAIDVVETHGYPSGTVVEQLTPAYRHRGRLIKYAQVRIAK